MKAFKILATAAAFSMALIGGASAATITDTLPEFNYDGGPTFPSPEQTVGTFNFVLPINEVITSASVSGTFGNNSNPTSAEWDLYGDGDFLGSCQGGPTCISANQTPFTFAVTDLSKLLDGEYVLTLIQQSESITRLGATTLTIETSPIPVPASLPLLLAGVGGLVALRRRKKS